MRGIHYAKASRLADRMRWRIWTKDWERLRGVGNQFERGRCHRETWKALSAYVEIPCTTDLPIWRGPQHPCEKLLVLPRSRDLGDELRIIRFVAHAARDVPQVTALVEARLIPLLQRSFPSVEFVDRKLPLDPARFSHMAAQERLAYWYGTDEEAIQQSFLPLIPPLPQAKNRHGVSALPGTQEPSAKPSPPSTTGLTCCPTVPAASSPCSTASETQASQS